MNIQVAIPTYKKTETDIINLYHFLNLSTDALFSVQQSQKEEVKEIYIGEHKVTIIYLTSSGVSINRNSLLKHASGDIIINTDDDCPLVSNYSELVIRAYNTYKEAEALYFNGVWATHNNRLITNKKSKRVTKFRDISFAGGPGFTYKNEKLRKYGLSFKEDIGFPNYICAGEDSCFYYDLVKKKVHVYRIFDVLFKVAIDETNSSYHKGINKQYVVTRGYITRLLHPIFFRLYLLRHLIRFHNQDKIIPIKLLKKWLIEGSKYGRD